METSTEDRQESRNPQIIKSALRFMALETIKILRTDQDPQAMKSLVRFMVQWHPLQPTALNIMKQWSEKRDGL